MGRTAEDRLMYRRSVNAAMSGNGLSERESLNYKYSMKSGQGKRNYSKWQQTRLTLSKEHKLSEILECDVNDVLVGALKAADEHGHKLRRTPANTNNTLRTLQLIITRALLRLVWPFDGIVQN